MAYIHPLLRRLQRPRRGSVANVGRLDFAAGRGRFWTYEWHAEGAFAGLRLRLTPVRVLGESAVAFTAYASTTVDRGPRRLERVHAEVFLSPQATTLHEAVGAARKFTRRAAAPIVPGVLADAAAELTHGIDRRGSWVSIGDAPVRVGLPWAVREGADPRWLQDAWDACEQPLLMGALLRTLPGVPEYDVPWTRSRPRTRFPNMMCDERLFWEFGGVYVVLRHGKRCADAIRRVVPKLPTVAEMIAAQTAQGDAS